MYLSSHNNLRVQSTETSGYISDRFERIGHTSTKKTIVQPQELVLFLDFFLWGEVSSSAVDNSVGLVTASFVARFPAARVRFDVTGVGVEGPASPTATGTGMGSMVSGLGPRFRDTERVGVAGLASTSATTMGSGVENIASGLAVW